MAENNNNGREIAVREAPKQKWTVMVYLAGDNNLTANCISVLQQLEAVKYNDSVCVLACFDSNTPWPKGSRYLAVNCRRRQIDNGLDWEIHNDLIPPDERGHAFQPPSFCDGSPSIADGQRMKRPEVAEGLRRFLDWAMNQNARSERTMLILYGHGPVVAGQSFLARDNPPSSLLLGDLKKILAEYFTPEAKLDILACQNCVMNGIETAYEVRDQVKYMIGSQGLVLATGWPYEKIIGAMVEKPDAPTHEIATKLLKACAKNLIDFSVMDRSSEQSLCNVDRLLHGRAENGTNIVKAVYRLVYALKKGLQFHRHKERGLRFPEICDAIKLARLEAQSYWGEVFTDLYDFCERLVKKCNEAVVLQSRLLKTMGYDGEASARFKQTELLEILREIIKAAINVMDEIAGTKARDCKQKTVGIVEESYYIGAELQYSHGLSIFFPWTLPTEPYFFTKSGNEWVLRTAFETYCEYDFAEESKWSEFLEAFFKATLRKVRRSEREFYLRSNGNLDQGLVGEHIHAPSEVLAIDLQKSSSDTGKADPEVWSTVKNYPRRNYLSPTDCARKLNRAGRRKVGCHEFQHNDQPPVSYLGWNISGLVAEVIGAVKPVTPAPNGGHGGEVKTAAAASGSSDISVATPAPAAATAPTAAAAPAPTAAAGPAPGGKGMPKSDM
jgi:hypothetical protein